MSDSYSENWWTDLRWRVGTQFILWGTRIAPPGDAREAMITAFLGWSERAKEQWFKRSKEEAKLQEKAG